MEGESLDIMEWISSTSHKSERNDTLKCTSDFWNKRSSTSRSDPRPLKHQSGSTAWTRSDKFPNAQFRWNFARLCANLTGERLVPLKRGFYRCVHIFNTFQMQLSALCYDVAFLFERTSKTSRFTQKTSDLWPRKMKFPRRPLFSIRISSKKRAS